MLPTAARFVRTNAGNSYTLQLSSVPNAGTTTFNGTANAVSSVRTVTIDKNAALLSNSISTSYYLLNPFVPLGTIYGTGTPYAVVTSSFPPPATVDVGNSGAFANLTLYHDSTLTTVDADITERYSVQADNATSLMLCLNSSIANVTAQGGVDGLAAATESDRYTVDAPGNAALVSATVTVGGVTLNFT